MKKLHIVFIFFSVFMFSCDLYEGLMADAQLGDLRDKLMSSKHVSSEPGAEDLIVSGLSSILEGIGDVGIQALGAVADVVQGAEAAGSSQVAEASEEAEEQEEADEEEVTEEAKEAKEEGSSDKQKEEVTEEEVDSQGIEVVSAGTGLTTPVYLSVETSSTGSVAVETESKTSNQVESAPKVTKAIGSDGKGKTVTVSSTKGIKPVVPKLPVKVNQRRSYSWWSWLLVSPMGEW
ncbi:hypothetical protein BHO_0002200 (plasmid) [Borrelia hermsii YBT]|uniref:hypothetical protein n=1 Tax=Borrelia hermsii TaxID=140 RepID=UPI0003E39060|nr:hypothetical protein [Borrelia hermsii]AHH12941.1 hypothetical protein BHO_0002200 [Borrelia hermsii YBT]